MPTFDFDDHIEPVILRINGVEYQAVPGIPADDFAEFMKVFSRVGPLGETVKNAEGEARMAAFIEFVQVALSGLDLVLLPESAERIKERSKDKTNPVSATQLAAVYTQLAGYYLSGGQEAEDPENPGPTVGDNELSPTSTTTGGSSVDSSSSEAPASTDGPITT